MVMFNLINSRSYCLRVILCFIIDCDDKERKKYLRGGIKVLNCVHIVLIEIEYALTMLNYKVSRKSKRTGYQMVYLVVYMYFYMHLICDTLINK